MHDRKSISLKTLYRPAASSDLQAIRQLQESGKVGGVGLTEALLASSADTLCFVAALEDEVIGCILLTAVAGPERALALAPLAIPPAYREMQIGTELVRHALRQARVQGWKSVFVFGQPDFYCRFGFRSHTADGAETPLQGPRLLALELSKGTLEGWSGQLAYPDGLLIEKLT